LRRYSFVLRRLVNVLRLVDVPLDRGWKLRRSERLDDPATVRVVDAESMFRSIEDGNCDPQRSTTRWTACWVSSMFRSIEDGNCDEARVLSWMQIRRAIPSMFRSIEDGNCDTAKAGVATKIATTNGRCSARSRMEIATVRREFELVHGPGRCSARSRMEIATRVVRERY